MLADLIRAQRHAQRGPLRRAALLAALVAAASVLLLGLSGWFITAAAIAGAAGPAAATAFNYMLPSAGIRLLAIVRTGARYGERLAGHEAMLQALARLRPALFLALATGPAERSLALGTGEASARLLGDIDAVETRFIRMSAPWGIAAATLSGAALTMLGGVEAALAVLACLALLLFAGHHLAHRMEGPGQAMQRTAGALRQEFTSMIDAAPELRCFGLQDWAADRLDDAGRANGAACRAQAQFAGWFDLLHAGTLALAAGIALLLTADSGAAIAALAALAAAMTIDSAAPALRAMAERGRLREAEARLDTMLNDAASETIAPLPAGDSTIHIYGYQLTAGERVALIGPSGAGKTTLVEMLLGLRRSQPGAVMLGGTDLAAMPRGTMRHLFAWAPQDAALLAGTVRDNLRLAAPEADDGALWQALHDAALDDRVRLLDGGLDTWIGDNGVRLSGGERRRLSLARALLASAPWLLLDEPSEGLDTGTEALVATRLAARLNRTGQGLILVSHRPAMMALCGRFIPVGHAPLCDEQDRAA